MNKISQFVIKNDVSIKLLMSAIIIGFIAYLLAINEPYIKSSLVIIVPSIASAIIGLLGAISFGLELVMDFVHENRNNKSIEEKE